MSTQCPSCGFNNPSGMRFCGNCGAHLNSSPDIPRTEPVESPLSPEHLGIMVGTDLLERFRRAGLEATGQRRNVTILFADLSGYTGLAAHIDSDDLYELVGKFTNILADDVYKYEGMVDKFTGDGLMAIFGAPIAHENNAELAVRSALDMQVDVEQLSYEVKSRLGAELHVRIGLHSGSVIVGGIGTDKLMNYTAIGDTVNLAQRLEETASPGTILTSESVYRQTRALVDFEPTPSLQLRGILHPTKGYRVVGLKPAPGSVRGIEGLRAPMIGRDSELRQLMQAIGTLATYKQGQFILIVGEAGIGKSRLVTELMELTRQVPVGMYEGHSLTYRRSVSYWMFLDLLRDYLQVNPDTPASQIRESLAESAERVLGFRASEVIPYLEQLLSLPPADGVMSQRVEYLEASQLRQQIFLAVRDLIVAEARYHPTVIILEDLHWVDEASLELLHFLLDSVRQAPLLIIAVTRPFHGGTTGKIVEWSRQNLVEQFSTIQLQNLSPHQSEQLLSQLLTIPNLPEKLREQIIQRAAGIPFYLEEILRMLIDEGVIQRKGNQWLLVEGMDIKSLGVPETLQGLILARFDHIERPLRRVLQVASVIGRQFSLPVLMIVLSSMDERELIKALSRLIEREFILPQPGSNSTEFVFNHVLVSDAIYSTLLKRERSELHGQVGEAIEIIYADRLDEQIDLLARHFSWSPKKNRALHYLILAGQKAARRYINDQARRYFEDALTLLPTVKHTKGQAYQVHVGLGDILLLTGEYPLARQHYQRTLDNINAESSDQFTEEQCILQRKVGTTYERQGNYEEALTCLAKAQWMADKSPSPMPIEKARILNDIGWINFRRGNLEEAEKYLIDALGLVKDTSRYDVTASIYNRLGGVYFQKDQLDHASNYVQKSLAMREEIGDIVAVARSYNNLGLLSWKRGQWDSALANFMRSVELHANLGDVEGEVELTTNLALLQLDRGNIEEAKKNLDKSLATAQQIGHNYIIGITYLYYSRLYLSMEDWQTAIDYSNRSLAILREIGDMDHMVDVHVNLGLALLGQGCPDQAKQQGEEALQLINQTDGSNVSAQAENRGRALRLLGETNRLQGNYEGAEKLVKEAATLFVGVGNQLEQSRSAVSMAMLALSRGDQIGARVLFNEARLIFRQLGANLDLQKLEELMVRQPNSLRSRT